MNTDNQAIKTKLVPTTMEERTFLAERLAAGCPEPWVFDMAPRLLEDVEQLTALIGRHELERQRLVSEVVRLKNEMSTMVDRKVLDRLLNVLQEDLGYDMGV